MEFKTGVIFLVLFYVLGVFGGPLSFAVQRQGYMEGMYTQPYLERIAQHDPDNYAVRYYRGMLFLQQGDGSAAINEWDKYSKTAPVDGRLMSIRERLTVLKQLQAQSLVKTSLKQNPQELVQRIRTDSVGILNFFNRGSDKYASLSKGLTGMLITDLLKVPQLTVVERERIQALMQEMTLKNTKLMSTQESVRLGQFLMAEHIVWGDFIDYEDQTIELNYAITQTRDASEVYTHKERGPIKDLLKLEKKVAFGILNAIGIKKEHLAPTVLEAINQVQTQDINAFLSYGEGLERLDQGHYEAAKSTFLHAAQLDPHFHLAQEAMLNTPEDPDFAEFLQHMKMLHFEDQQGPREAGGEYPPDPDEPNPQSFEYQRMDSDTIQRQEPRIELRLDPDTGSFENAQGEHLEIGSLGLPIDPHTGLPIDPDTGQFVNPINGELISLEQFENDPDFRREIIKMIRSQNSQETTGQAEETTQMADLGNPLGFDFQDPDNPDVVEDSINSEPEPQAEEVNPEEPVTEPDGINNPLEEILATAIDPDANFLSVMEDIPTESGDIIDRWGYLIGPLMVKKDTDETFKTYVYNRDLQNLNDSEGIIEWGENSLLRYNGENPAPVPALTDLVVNGHERHVGELQFDFIIDPASKVSGDLRWYYWTLVDDLSFEALNTTFSFDQSGFAIFGNPTERFSERIINYADHNITATYFGFSKGIFFEDAIPMPLSGSFNTRVNFNTGIVSDFNFVASTEDDPNSSEGFRVSLENGSGRIFDNSLLNFEISSGSWKVNRTTIPDAVTTDARGALYGPEAQNIGGIWSIQTNGAHQAHGIFAGAIDPDSITQDNTEGTDSTTTPVVTGSRQGAMIGQASGNIQTATATDTEGAAFKTIFQTQTVQDFEAGGQISGPNGSQATLRIDSNQQLTLSELTFNGNTASNDFQSSGSLTENQDPENSNDYLSWGTWNLPDVITLQREQGAVNIEFSSPNYYLLGDPTQADQLATLASQDVSATYAGQATGMVGDEEPIELDQGAFSVHVRFQSGEITDFTLNASSSTRSDKFISIKDAQGMFEPGSHNFEINADSGVWEINGATEIDKDARGAFFGDKAAAMGGIWRMEGEGENRGYGIFSGQRTAPANSTTP